MPSDSATQSKTGILRTHEFFRDLSDAAIRELASHARHVSYRAGDPIFSKGDEGHGLFAVLAGAVRISASSDDGREIVVNLIGQGEVFGEIALLDGGPRTANAGALIDCTLLSIDHRDFMRVLLHEPAIAIGLLRVLCKRLRKTTAQVEEMNSGGFHARLAKTLLLIADFQGKAKLTRPELQLTQKQLGDMLGISRESTNRQLRQWQRKGIIDLEKGVCIINHPERLSRLAAGSTD